MTLNVYDCKPVVRLLVLLCGAERNKRNKVARCCAKLESQIHAHVDIVLQQMFTSASTQVLNSSCSVMSCIQLTLMSVPPTAPLPLVASFASLAASAFSRLSSSFSRFSRSFVVRLAFAYVRKCGLNNRTVN